MKNTKSKYVGVRFSATEFRLVESLGDREGLRTSELIRIAIREAAEKRGLYPVGKREAQIEPQS